MTKSLNEIRDELAKQQRIYEPKYGGKDHSGYETMMKYEINDEREEAFYHGFDAGVSAVMEQAEKLEIALSYKCMCYDANDPRVDRNPCHACSVVAAFREFKNRQAGK